MEARAICRSERLHQGAMVYGSAAQLSSIRHGYRGRRLWVVLISQVVNDPDCLIELLRNLDGLFDQVICQLPGKSSMVTSAT